MFPLHVCVFVSLGLYMQHVSDEVLTGVISLLVVEYVTLS